MANETKEFNSNMFFLLFLRSSKFLKVKIFIMIRFKIFPNKWQDKCSWGKKYAHGDKFL